MKKTILILAVVLSFTYAHSANQKPYTKTNHVDSLYVVEEEADEAFDFNHKAYLPKDFQAYDLTDNEADVTLWVDENNDDEAFDFDYTAYLPVGFNPSKKLNHLFLDTVKLINEEEDEPFYFNTSLYVRNFQEKVLVTLQNK
ncbi:MAG: hypothetical protein QM486_10415 [Flavobacteriaceae bacterium]